MPTYEFPIVGAEKLRKQLAALGPRIAKKVIRQSLRQAGKIVQTEAKSNAPVDTGRLRKSIRVRAFKRSRKERIGINVQTNSTNNVFKGKTFYGGFLEYGFRRGKRSNEIKRAQKNGRTLAGDLRQQVPSRPFMKPAFESKKEQAGKMAVDLLRAGVEREASR